jgi:ATP-dependent DNA helicase RecG
MITRTIESDDALKMCSRPEDHFFDRKGIAVQPAKLLRHIAAFANADGGELVVGIDDEKIGGTGTDCWNGTANIEGFNGFIQALREIDPP